MERIGDESLTRGDSGFVHDKMFPSSGRHPLDRGSPGTGRRSAGLETPPPVNLCTDCGQAPESLMVNPLLPRRFPEQSLNGNKKIRAILLTLRSKAERIGDESLTRRCCGFVHTTYGPFPPSLPPRSARGTRCRAESAATSVNFLALRWRGNAPRHAATEPLRPGSNHKKGGALPGAARPARKSPVRPCTGRRWPRVSSR